MVAPWFTTPWRLVSNPTGLLLRILCLPSSAGSHPRDVRLPCATSRHPSWPIPRVLCLLILLGLSCGPSPTPFSVLSPFPILPVFIPHRVASNPLARAHWILIHPGTVSCAYHWSLPSRPLPFGWCVSFRTCSGPFFLAPASPLTRAFSILSPAVAVFSFGRHPASLVCPSFPSRSPAACSLCALRPPVVIWGFVFVFFRSAPPPPFPAVHPALGGLLPACTHVSTALVVWSQLPSVLFFCPIALLGRGPRRSPAMPGGRPFLASLPSLPSLPSPLFCLSPAHLLLLSCFMCPPLVFPAPGLYLARSHAPLSLRPVL